MTTAIRLIAAPAPAPAAPAKRDPLAERAARLWPDSERNQREWVRAVTVVRRTRRGWLLDHPVTRRQA